jgi:thymidine kinase
LRVAAVASLSEIGTPEEDIIGIDEGQFYPDLAKACKQWALTKRIFVAALDGDFRQSIFPSVGALIPLADSVRKLTGVCMVCRDAPSVFSVRITGDTSLELIGGLNLYRAVCRGCSEVDTSSRGSSSGHAQ